MLRKLLILLTVSLLGQNAPERIVVAIQEKLMAGDTATARSEIFVRLAEYPGDGGLYNLLGVLEGMEGNAPGAETQFKRAISLSPKLVGAYLNLGRLQAESDSAESVKNSVVTLRKLLSFAPGQAEARLLLAKSLHWLGRFQESSREVILTRTLISGSAEAISLECGNQAGLTRRTAAICRQLIGNPDLSSEVAMIAIPALLSHGQARFAVELLDGLRLQDKLSDSGKLWLARALKETGEAGRARILLQNLANASPEDPEPLSELARSFYEEGKRDTALTYLAKARDLRPNDPGLHFFMGIVLVEMDLPVEARKSLQQAVDLMPENEVYRYALGAVTLQGFGAAEAVPHFRYYVERRPTDASGHLALGTALFQSTDYEAAKASFLKADRDPKTRATATYFLGRIARLNGDYVQAQTMLEKAIVLRANYPEALAELAQTKIRLDDLKGAKVAVDRALALDPENRPANQALLFWLQKTNDPAAEQQRKRVDDLEQMRQKKLESLLRGIEFRPY